MIRISKTSPGIKISSSENAAAAKARCMYADMLSPDDYKQLILCDSVGEVATYLNSKKRYADIFSSERALSSLHRSSLEWLLEKRKYGDYVKLSSYLMGSGTYIRDFFSSRREANILIRAVSSLGIHGTDEPFHLYLSNFGKNSDIDMHALSEAVTYDEILSSAQRSPYYSILLKYKSDTAAVDTVHLEAELWDFIFDDIFGRIEKLPSASEREEAYGFFKTYIDSKNISAIARFYGYPECDGEYIMRSLMKHGNLSEKKLAELIDGRNDISQQRGKEIKKLLELGYDSETSVCRKKCKKYLRYSTHPAIIVLSYLYLLEAELGNIIKIVEGIRYSLAKEQITAMISEE